MSNSLNILLIKGGGGPEHDISLLTSNYIKEKVSNSHRVYEVLISKNKQNNVKSPKHSLANLRQSSNTTPWYLVSSPELNDMNCSEGISEYREVELTHGGKLKSFNESRGDTKSPKIDVNIDLVIPALHGHPGETGHIQAYLDTLGLPYIGCSYESSLICFNKVLTKLWLDKVDVPTLPFIMCNKGDYLENKKLVISKLHDFLNEHQQIFIKASNQGSSIGCYPIESKDNLKNSLDKAFGFSEFVLVEKLVRPRELEIAVFNYNGKVEASFPSEIRCPDYFYSYEQKYSSSSKTKTTLRANISDLEEKLIKDYALRAFKLLGLKEFCRMDFFLISEDSNTLSQQEPQVFLNEINTFPGMTPISLFPKMIEDHGIKFCDFLEYHIQRSTSSQK